MRAENWIGMDIWKIYLCGDTPLFANPSEVVMVTTFMMWSTFLPAKLSVISAPVVSKNGGLLFANTYASMMVV